MRKWLGSAAASVFVVAGLLVFASHAASGQAAGQAPAQAAGRGAGQAPAQGAGRGPAYTPRRTPDGQPDLTGIWQSVNAAAWDLEDHAARMGVPGGYGIVEGGKIPYLPAALMQRNQNYEKRATEDPEAKCYLPGVPRMMFMPFPFEIMQFEDSVVMFHEYLGHTRTVFFNGQHPDPNFTEFWMGDSRGRWEGNTLVVDVANLNDQTWFDRSGNFHSSDIHIVERYTRASADRIDYEATITDPQVFSRPWTIHAPLIRRQEPNLRILEYECHAYMEEEAAQGNVKLPWSTLEFEGMPRK